MTVNAAALVTAYRMEGRPDARSPSGIWSGVVSAPGDLTGGQTSAILQGPYRAVYLVEGYTVATVGADSYSVSTMPNLVNRLSIDLGGGVTASAQSTFKGESGRIRVYLAQEANGDLLRLLKANTNGETDRLTAWGLWWDMALARAAGVVPWAQ